jgi:hypothetical protein
LRVVVDELVMEIAEEDVVHHAATLVVTPRVSALGLCWLLPMMCAASLVVTAMPSSSMVVGVVASGEGAVIPRQGVEPFVPWC